MTWEDILKKNTIDAKQLAQEFSSYIRDKMVDNLQAEGYEELIYLPLKVKMGFQKEISMAIESWQNRLNDAVLSKEK